MWLKKISCMVLSLMLIIGTISFPANATEVKNTASKNFIMNFQDSRATGSFNMKVPANSKMVANSSFPLAAGETVTIKASYSPFSASVDFGLIAPNGRYYYFNITNGSIDKTIQVDESGNYTLQVRNNSNYEVDVAGFVNY